MKAPLATLYPPGLGRENLLSTPSSSCRVGAYWLDEPHYLVLLEKAFKSTPNACSAVQICDLICGMERQPGIPEMVLPGSGFIQQRYTVLITQIWSIVSCPRWVFCFKLRSTRRTLSVWFYASLPSRYQKAALSTERNPVTVRNIKFILASAATATKQSRSSFLLRQIGNILILPRIGSGC